MAQKAALAGGFLLKDLGKLPLPKGPHDNNNKTMAEPEDESGGQEGVTLQMVAAEIQLVVLNRTFPKLKEMQVIYLVRAILLIIVEVKRFWETI